MQQNVYPTRVDAWLALVLLAGFATCVGATVSAAWQQAAVSGWLSALPGVALALLLVGVLWLACWPCVYTLEPAHLYIRCGLLRRRIPYAGIRALRKSANPLAAPAYSLRRVHIEHEHGVTLISPVARDAFIADLRARIDHARQAPS